jgi:hypothetical protein
VETRVDESQSPLPFVIALQNAGGAATDVEGISIEGVDGVILPGAKTSAAGESLETIAADECRIDMREGHPTAIPAGGDGVACGFVTWERPSESTPAVAAVSARFRVTLTDGETIETPPRALLLASDAGAVETMLDELTLDREDAAKLLGKLESLPGERTENFSRLIKRLRSLAK